MATQALVRKLGKEVEELRSDMRGVKEFLFAPFEDSEGEYQQSFVKKMLRRSQSGKPFYEFSGKDSFLAHVHRGK